MKKILDWLDERTGWRKVKEVLLDRHIPKGVNWWYTLGSVTLFLFVVQVVTGILLAMNYSPTPDHAYDSVKYIGSEVPMGRLLQAIHQWGATCMVVVITLHLLRVFFMGAYKYPREMTWITGVGLFCLVIGFAFTGYLLPWDQKAYWATTVGVHMAEYVPFVGSYLGRIMKGGPTLGAVTLTRFYAIHVLLLPALILSLIGLHLFLVVWHGISAPPEKMDPSEAQAGDWKDRLRQRYLQLKEQGRSFFPYIIFKDMVAIMLVYLVLSLVAYLHPAQLDALADPTSTTYNPRPEWYFLSVFEVLKFFPGRLEAFAIVLLPLVVFGLLFGLPFLDKGPKRHPLQRPFWTGAGVAALAGLVVLTVMGARTPMTNPQIKRDPLVVEGKRLFHQLNCEYCHRLHGHGGIVGPALDNVGLHRSRDWLAAHFRNPQKVTPGSKMPNFHLMPGEIEALVAYMSSLGGAPFTAQAPRLFEDNCAFCHKFHGVGESIGPDLSHIAQYRDSAYIAAYITNPVALNKQAAMQGFKGELTDAQIKDLANYLYDQGK